ncbi:MAG: ABC transporter permease [Epsilonproteobacteria bacterium]|nr:ABC transporter permease [Campylobacterota bacterium]
MRNSRFIKIEEKKSFIVIKGYGKWISSNLDKIEKELLDINCKKDIKIDLNQLTQIDSNGVLLLIYFKNRCKKEVEITGLNKKAKRLYKLVEAHYISKPLPQRRENLLYRIGKRAIELIDLYRSFFNFIGEFFIKALLLFRSLKNFRFKELIYHIEHSAIEALPIIALTAILVGLVIAYQTIVQLKKFGADIYAIDALAISITRELGPMLTAIVVAGRSASSYTAEIGAMKITEEINAMKTMGFDPFYFLVFPRVFALIIAMPLLIFFSDIIGILGGMIALKYSANISYHIFIERLKEVLDIKHYILGMLKGPFFAFIIAIIGSFHGFRVSRDSESIGIETTASVVHAIFLVIAIDALFSIIFTEFGW